MPNKETINDMVTQTPSPSGSGTYVNQNITITTGNIPVFMREKILTIITLKTLISHQHAEKFGKFSFLSSNFSVTD